MPTGLQRFKANWRARPWRRISEEQVVITRTPGEWCEPGTIYQWREGHPWYRITRVAHGRWGQSTVFGVCSAPPVYPAGEFHAKSVLSLGDLGPGESTQVPLDRGWRVIVRADPPAFPLFRLWGHKKAKR